MPQEQDPADDQRLCVFLIEKALSKLPTGEEQILAVFDLRGFGPENADLKYLKFLVMFFFSVANLPNILVEESVVTPPILCF